MLLIFDSRHYGNRLKARKKRYVIEYSMFLLVRSIDVNRAEESEREEKEICMKNTAVEGEEKRNENRMLRETERKKHRTD